MPLHSECGAQLKDRFPLPMTGFPLPGLTRRNLLLGTGSLLATACSQTPSLSLVKDSFSVAFPNSSDYPRTREQVEALPYAQLAVRIGSGSHGIMVLNKKSGDDLYWLSANRVLLVTRKGRLVRTVGLPVDLLGARVRDRDLLDHYNPDKPEIDGFETTVTVDIGTSYGAILKSRYRVEGSETIQILGETYDTLRVREEIDCESWSWRANNIHWLSKRSPMIWRSRQNLFKGQPPIELEILKRPA